MLVAAFFLCTTSAFAATKTLTVGSTSGSYNATVSLPITIDDPSGVGGIAFTLGYDPDLFDFIGLEKIEKAISDGSEYSTIQGETVSYTGYTAADIADTLFYQVNAETVPGRVMVAAASAKALTGTQLFNAKFFIKGGFGRHPIDLLRTIIHNPDAGYNEPTFLEVLVGMPALEPDQNGYYPAPIYPASLVSGYIEVQPPTYKISGSVTYQGGAQANGSVVDLWKLTDTGDVFVTSQNVTSGAYAFTSRPGGAYRLEVHPYEQGYDGAGAEVQLVDQDVTQDFVLPAVQYTPKSGTVLVGTAQNSRVLLGMKVKVVDASGNVVAVYPLNENGYFETEPIPNDYTLYAVYGNQETEITAGETTYWDLTLYSIGGTVMGLGSGEQVAIEAQSRTGKLTKVQTFTAASDVSYTITDLVPASDYIVSATSEGNPVQYYTAVTDITAATQVDLSTGDRTEIDFDFTTVEKATIAGQVTKDASPVASIGVYAFDVNSYAVVSKLTDSSGNFSLDVPPGSYELFVYSGQKAFYWSDTGTVQSEFDATILSVSAGDSLTGKNLDLTECACVLSGKVTYERADGDPVSGALVSVIGESSEVSVLTKRDGTYTITGLCKGQYTVEMNPLIGQFAVQRKSLTLDDNNCGSATVNFVIDTGSTLSGQVTDGSTGISGATLYLVDDSTGELVGGRMFFTNLSGYYTISDIPDGIYTLEVSHPDYQSATVDDLAISSDTTQNVTLSKGAYVYGTVTDNASGNPLAMATIIAVVTGEDPAYAVTNQSGNYWIWGLDSSKTYLVFASKRGYERGFNPAVTPAADPGTQVDFALAPPALTFNLSGTVTAECSPFTVTNATVIASYSPGTGSDYFKWTRTDQSGQYSFTGLPQNANYRLTVVPPGNLKVQVLTGIDGTQGDVVRNVVIPCGSSISGTITGAASGAVVYVMLYNAADNSFVDYTVAAVDGTYSFEGLTSGSYKVVAVAGGSIKWYDNADTIGAATSVSPGDTGVNITLQ